MTMTTVFDPALPVMRRGSKAPVTILATGVSRHIPGVGDSRLLGDTILACLTNDPKDMTYHQPDGSYHRSEGECSLDLVNVPTTAIRRFFRGGPDTISADPYSSMLDALNDPSEDVTNILEIVCKGDVVTGRSCTQPVPDAPAMDTYTACGIAEGFIECDDEDRVIEAWQYLVDTGICWTLQGWFGRTARDLIAAGKVLPADRAAVSVRP